MGLKKHLPGEFPDISDRREYLRLVALARKRLVGFEHHAEDVVSLAMIKWARLSARYGPAARIEQVVKSEAYSFLRSQHRSQARDTMVHHDPTSPLAGGSRSYDERDLVLLRQAMAETAVRNDIELTKRDVEVFELLGAGYSISDIVRATGYSRHQVKTSRHRLQQLLRLTPAEANDPAST